MHELMQHQQGFPMVINGVQTTRTHVGLTATGVPLRAMSAFMCIAILAVSFWATVFTGGTHPDVSWLILVADRMLDGQRLYVDILDNNPPFAVWLYLPAAWLGRLTPLSAETWTILITYAWVLAFGALALRLTRRLGLTTGAERLIIAPFGMYALVLLAPATFSQREHFAVAGALPMLVLAAWRMKRHGPVALPWAWIVVASVGAAVPMMLKPHYALFFLLPYLLAAWTARSPRVLFAPEVLVAALIVLAYGVWIWIAHRAYVTEILPELVSIYGYRLDLLTLLAVASLMEVLLAMLLAAMLWRLPRDENPLAWSFAAAAAGAYCAFLYMGKGWNYHLLPSLCLTCLAISFAGVRRLCRADMSAGNGHARLLFAGLALTASVMVTNTRLTWERDQVPAWLVERIAAVASHPAVAGVSEKIEVGHPWTRSFHGAWIGRDCADWIVAGGMKALAAEPDMPAAGRERIEGIIADAVDRKTAEWKRTPPDLVMLDAVPTGWIGPITENPEFMRLLSGYRVVFANDRVRLALRSDLVPAWEAATVGASSPGEVSG